MTRKEWIEKNLPAFINNNAGGGVMCCPGSYRELVRIDPSVLTNKTCRKRCGDDSFDVCEECWNMELNVKEERKETMTRREFVIKNYGKEVANDEVPMPVIGRRFWTFVHQKVSSYTDLLVVGNFVIVALMWANAEIRVVAKDETLDLEYIFFYDLEKKCIRKLPKDWALEKKYPEIDFTIYWDEESMNKAKRGIVTDREYENQYILLKKADNKKGE